MSTRSTSNLVGRKYDFASTISLLNAESYPMLAILSNNGKDPATKKGKALNKQAVSDPEFKWTEDTFGSREATIAASQSIDPDAGGETFDVATGEGARFAVGDVITLLTNKWTFEVTAVNGDTLTVGKELGGTTGNSTAVSGTVWIIGNANEEGAGLREIKSTSPVEKTGYCQIFRTPFGVTETSKATKTLIAEDDLAYQRRKKGIEHAVDIERALLFSKKAKDLTGSKPKRYTEGIINAINSNAAANITTETAFEAFMEDVFKDGSTEKYVLASAGFISMVNSFAKSQIRTTRNESTYGIRIHTYDSPQGTLHIIKHKLLTGTPYGNYGVVVDFAALKYRVLRDTKLLTNRQSPGDDEVIEEFLTEAGLQIEQESRHAIISTGAL